MLHVRYALAAMLVVVGVPACTTWAMAQTPSLDPWGRVESVSPGTKLTIVGVHRLPCTFLSATNDALYCQEYRPISRGRIEEVRYARAGKDSAVGAVLGAAAGAGISTAAGGRSAGQIGAALGLGAIVGGFIGRVHGLRNGPLIYRR